MTADYQALETSYAASERRSKYWKLAALIGIPTAAAISGAVAWMAAR
jgi:hypothetical protein